MISEQNMNRFQAVILAAGLSRRMGQPKMVLPWGNTTVIGQIVSIFQESGVDGVTVVTGGASSQVQSALAGTHVQIVFNPEHADGNMLTSLKVGLIAQPAGVEAVFVALGDQPFIESAVVEQLAQDYTAHPTPLLVPSYQMHRGHPWLLRRELWPEIIAMPAGATMHDFLTRHSAEIRYRLVDSPTVIQDMDTLEDYEQLKPHLETPDD